MSIHKSYLDKNNTIIFNSSGNTGQNPVTELFYGRTDNVLSTPGYSRFIFNIDLSDLQQKISDGVVYTGSTMKHVFKMTNTIMFNYELLNTTTSDNRLRATGFNLNLFRIPKTSGSTGSIQTWDEGVGYDYYNTSNLNSANASLTSNNYRDNDKSYSSRPSNWYKRNTLNNWSVNGIYSNLNTDSNVNFTGLTLVDTQYFQFGNENIEFDMTNEINNILTGATTGVTGYIVSFDPQLENITGLTENYSVGFFTRHTQTFYEPYLETTYDDLILDDRNRFFENKVNKIYLYSYIDGTPTNLDFNPKVNISDSNGNLMSGFTGLTTVLRTQGIYECTIPPITGYSTPCQFNDTWSGATINGVSIGDIENDLILRPKSEYYQIGVNSKDPKLYSFTFSGIKQDEKILDTDIRKVVVSIKEAYSSNVVLPEFKAYYRVYVKEGKTEVIVQDWTRINETPNEYYFMFDTKDKIPNEYFLDIKVLTSGEVDTYKRQLKFQIVNQK